MNIANNPSRLNIQHALQKQREARTAREIEVRLQRKTEIEQKIAQKVQKLNDTEKEKLYANENKRWKAIEEKEAQEKRLKAGVQLSDINIAHNDVSLLNQEISAEVEQEDKWALTISRMQLKPLQKVYLMQSVILESVKGDDVTKVLLGCSSDAESALKAVKTEIESAMGNISRRKIQIDFKVLTVEELVSSPSERFEQIFKRRQREAFNALAMDSQLNLLKEAFDCSMIIADVVPLPQTTHELTETGVL